MLWRHQCLSEYIKVYYLYFIKNEENTPQQQMFWKYWEGGYLKNLLHILQIGVENINWEMYLLWIWYHKLLFCSFLRVFLSTVSRHLTENYIAQLQIEQLLFSPIQEDRIRFWSIIKQGLSLTYIHSQCLDLPFFKTPSVCCLIGTN